MFPDTLMSSRILESDASLLKGLVIYLTNFSEYITIVFGVVHTVFQSLMLKVYIVILN